MLIHYLEMEWRTGRKVGRTVYAIIGSTPSDRDVLIGVMDTASIAAHVVRAHNTLIMRGEQI